jgi:hypothetical protein
MDQQRKANLLAENQLPNIEDGNNLDANAQAVQLWFAGDVLPLEYDIRPSVELGYQRTCGKQELHQIYDCIVFLVIVQLFELLADMSVGEAKEESLQQIWYEPKEEEVVQTPPGVLRTTVQIIWNILTLN